MNNKPIGLLIADLHLSLTAPTWRANEPDWLAAQDRQLDQLRVVQDKYKCPIFCAGDIFDEWYGAPGKGAAELINFAINNLPLMYTIPGQHDLPDHSMRDICRSAYWTLVAAGAIVDLRYDGHAPITFKRDYQITACGYGSTLPKPRQNKLCQIALIHQYNWMEKAVRGGPTPDRGYVTHDREEFKGYDIIVSGDNHIPFTYHAQSDGWLFCNCGCFIRRNANEINYKPRINILWSDGSVTPHYLNTEKDRHVNTTKPTEQPTLPNLDEMMADLNTLGDAYFSFKRAAEAYIAKYNPPRSQQRELFRAMEEDQ